MRALAAIAGCLALAVAGGGALTVKREPPVLTFSEEERAAILAHGPWPPRSSPDPSNRVSGDPAAIALGRQLFSDKRLSSDGRSRLRDLPRSRPVLRRRPRPQRRARPRGPQRHRARQPAAQPLVRLGGRCRQPVGAEPAPDPRREGARRHGRARARAAGRRRRRRRSLRAPLRLGAGRGRARARRWSMLAKALAAFQETITTRPHALRRFPRCARASGDRRGPGPLSGWLRSEA